MLDMFSTLLCRALCLLRLTLKSFHQAVFHFFFQAEDGIRDVAVTGVQTCALPILVAQLLAGQRSRRPALIESVLKKRFGRDARVESLNGIHRLSSVMAMKPECN